MRINKDLMRSLGLGLLSAQTGPSRTPITGWQTFGKGLASGFDRYNKLQERQAEIARQEIEDKRSAEEFKLRQQQAKATLEAAQRKARLDAAKEQGIQAWLADPDNQKKYPAFVAAYKAGFPPSTAVKLMPSKASDTKLEAMTRAQAAATIAHYKGMNKPFSELDMGAQEKLNMARHVMTTPKYQRDPATGDWVAIAQNLPEGVQKWFDATPSPAGQSGVVPQTSQASEPSGGPSVQVIKEGEKGKKRREKIARIDDHVREGIGMLRRGKATSGVRGLFDDWVAGAVGQAEEFFTGMPSEATGNDKFREMIDILANDLLPEINPDERFTKTDVDQIRKIAGELRIETRAGQILSRLERLAKIMGTDLSGLGFDSANQTAADKESVDDLLNRPEYQ